jgi:hypothetical protein
MSVMTMKFAVSLEDSSGRMSLISLLSSHRAGANLESPNSNPIIVISHESQWTDAANKLLIQECFADSKSSSVCHCRL